MLNKTKMVKKGGIRFSENEEVNIPVFGEQEIEIPEYLAEKTAKGYQLIPTLTKSGAITKRHKEPSIKLTAKNIEYFSIPKNGVERLQLSDFVKKSKAELVKQYEVYIDFQNKLLAVELKNVLKIPEVKKMVAEADDKAEAIEEIKEVLTKEIFGDVPEPKVKKTATKPKVKMTISRKEMKEGKELNGTLTGKILRLDSIIKEFVEKILHQMIYVTIKKRMADDAIPLKEGRKFFNLGLENMQKYPYYIRDIILENKYNLIDKDTLDEYNAMRKKLNELDKEREDIRNKIGYKVV